MTDCLFKNFRLFAAFLRRNITKRIKNSKIVRAITYAMKVKVVLQIPALPEGRGEQK